MEHLRRPDALVIVGFPERAEGGAYNSAAALFPDERALIYRKSHLFGPEKTLFLAEGQAGVSFWFKGVKMGLLICSE